MIILGTISSLRNHVLVEALNNSYDIAWLASLAPTLVSLGGCLFPVSFAWLLLFILFGTVTLTGNTSITGIYTVARSARGFDLAFVGAFPPFFVSCCAVCSSPHFGLFGCFAFLPLVLPGFYGSLRSRPTLVSLGVFLFPVCFAWLLLLANGLINGNAVEIPILIF